MRTGVTTRDIEHYNPRCSCGGTIKAGTEVYWSTVAKLWVVRYQTGASFMSSTDFRHSFVDVPADAVQPTEEKPCAS